MKRLFVAIVTVGLLAGSALAAGDYDKSTKTSAYDLRLRVPAAALAVAPLKAELFKRWKHDSGEITTQADSDKKEMPQFFHPYALDTQWRKREAEFTAIHERITRLTNRDRETLEFILSGEPNKAIAAKLSLTLVSIARSLAAAEIANALHLRGFRSLAIFEFFNTIGQSTKSLRDSSPVEAVRLACEHGGRG